MDGLTTDYIDAAGSLMATEIQGDMQDMGHVGDWENKEPHPRDPGCYLTYGVKNGVAFFSKTQTDLENYLKYAQAMRSRFINRTKGSKVGAMGQECWIMLHIIQDELELRGIPVQQIIESGNHSELHKIMLAEYPGLLLVTPKFLRSVIKKDY